MCLFRNVSIVIVVVNLLANISYAEKSVYELHQTMASSFYGEFVGVLHSNFTTSDAGVNAMKKSLLTALQLEQLPKQVTKTEIDKYAESYLETRAEEIKYIFAKMGDQYSKTIVRPESDTMPWTSITEQIVNGENAISVLHDFKSVKMYDLSYRVYTIKDLIFDPCDILYPLSIPGSVFDISRYDDGLLFAEWVNDSQDSFYVSVQSILDESTQLPIKTLIIYQEPILGSSKKIALCEFTDYENNFNRLYPKNWQVTVWALRNKDEQDLLKGQISAQMDIDLKNVDQLNHYPFGERYELVFDPLDLSLLTQNQDNYFWHEVQDGYTYSDYRERYKDINKQHVEAIRNGEQLNTELMQKINGEGPHVFIK